MPSMKRKTGKPAKKVKVEEKKPVKKKTNTKGRVNKRKVK